MNNMKSTCSAVILGVTSFFAVHASAADWSDTSMGISYGAEYREPGINKDIEKKVLNLTHASGYKYGSNFFNVNFLQSNDADPAAGKGNTNGAQEIYAVYRNQLSMSAVSGHKLSFGPVRDISLTTGFDIGTKNTGFAPNPIKLFIGPTLNFAVKNGFFDLGLFAYHESNNNGITGKSVNFDTTYCVSAAWSKRFNLGIPAVFKGYLSHIGTKGNDGFGAATGAETIGHALLMFDVGSLAGKKGTIYAGVGVDHFTNKYGADGVNQTTPIAQLEVHF